MELSVTGMESIPPQRLENKIAYVAGITDVFPSDCYGKRLECPIEMAGYIKVQIQNQSELLNGSSGMLYSRDDFTKLKEAYGVSDANQLVGRPVISVYTKDLGEMLCGLIAVKSER